MKEGYNKKPSIGSILLRGGESSYRRLVEKPDLSLKIQEKELEKEFYVGKVFRANREKDMLKEEIYFIENASQAQISRYLSIVGCLNPNSEVEARFFAIAQNDNRLLVVLNGA
jgi:hypothetical protein